MVDPHSIVILLLEDDEDDYVLAMASVEDYKLATRFYRVKDGVEGLAYLAKESGMADGPDEHKVPYDQCPTPDLIICDLEMPKMDGREFIVKIKDDKRYRRIPVVVLTSSRDERDVAEAYDFGAAAFIVKPINVTEMTAVIREIRDFYLTIVRLPRRG
jgi:CheY-like chemotaxis protein